MEKTHGQTRQTQTGSQTYTLRNQSETTNSMIKRNLGSALRAKTAKGREKEMMMRALTHNIMLLLDELGEG